MDDKQKQIHDKQLILDYKSLFDTDVGRRVFANLRKWSGFDDRIIPQGIPDVTAFELGRRDMFLHIKDKIDAPMDKERQVTAESEAEDAID